MLINIITLFPEMFAGVLQQSILGRARQGNYVEIHLKDLREFGIGSHKVVDDAPFGGGGGMILKPEPIAAALEDLGQAGHVIITTPRGKHFQHPDAVRLSRMKAITIICGHYEGIDERITELFADEELSIGDYVLTGGEIPAMVIADAVTRLIPGVLGKDTLETGDSHYKGMLEHPHYTRPREFRGIVVPEVLLSGNHEEIRIWRKKMAFQKTRSVRPDMLLRENDFDTDNLDREEE
ncbi:MAG TPA: tRNA (guanosine(37)-N1)-methyltransferase TrmD [Deltaproteobacteria bacterium]|nr:tRNA (guanosine(37)-N1)-methyltransferase TrmD [Deltaproteobacteria bacterium]